MKAPDPEARAALGKLKSGIAQAEKSDIIALDVRPGDAITVA